MTENEKRYVLAHLPTFRRVAFGAGILFLLLGCYAALILWDVFGSPLDMMNLLTAGIPALLTAVSGYFFYLAFRRRPEIQGLKPWPKVGRYRGVFGLRGKPTFFAINGWQINVPETWWCHFQIGQVLDVEVCPPIGKEYGSWQHPRGLMTVWTPERVYSIDQEVANGTLKVPQRRGWFSDPMRRFW